jgi:hypothetical protein
MRRWPWITIVLTAILALCPFGQDVFYLAFLSGEQLSRNIWRPLYLIAVALMIFLGLLEWSIETFIYRRRGGKTEP